jgi:hypothetical protein
VCSSDLDGFGTEAWSQMPTLSDFLDYFLHQGKLEVCLMCKNKTKITKSYFMIAMIAKIIDSQGNLVAVVKKQTISQENGEVLDRFIDDNDNLYLEVNHSDVIDGEFLMNRLVAGASRFYQIEGFSVDL